MSAANLFLKVLLFMVFFPPFPIPVIVRQLANARMIKILEPLPQPPRL